MERITREYFINKIADHRTKYATRNALLLAAEEKGSIGFFIDRINGQLYFALKDIESGKVLYYKKVPSLTELLL